MLSDRNYSGAWLPFGHKCNKVAIDMDDNRDDYQRKLSEFEEICRQRGVPLTIQRRSVLEALVQRHDHPTADQIFEDVHQAIPGISRTTVYRVLEALVKAGVAQRVCHPGAAARFDARTERHHHLVCVQCEKVLDVVDTNFEELSLPTGVSRGFSIMDYSIHFRGLCPDCQNPAKKTSVAEPKPVPAKKPKTK